MQTVNTICGALLLIVNFLGVAAIGYWVMLRLLRVKKGDRFAVILPIERASDAADKVFAAYLRLQWTHAGGRGAVIALDTGLSEAARDEVARFCRTMKNVYFCTPDELAGVLKKL